MAVGLRGVVARRWGGGGGREEGAERKRAVH